MRNNLQAVEDAHSLPDCHGVPTPNSRVHPVNLELVEGDVGDIWPNRHLWMLGKGGGGGLGAIQQAGGLSSSPSLSGTAGSELLSTGGRWETREAGGERGEAASEEQGSSAATLIRCCQRCKRRDGETE